MSKTKYDPEYRRARYLKDREKIIAWQKQYDDAHRDELRVKRRARYLRECEKKRQEAAK